jgi:hypothetical protein
VKSGERKGWEDSEEKEDKTRNDKLMIYKTYELIFCIKF